MKKILLFQVVVLVIISILVTLVFAGCKEEIVPVEEAAEEEEVVEEASEEEVTEEAEGEISDLEKSIAVDISDLVNASGQPLVQLIEPPKTPERPDNIDELTEQDALFWYNIEYLGIETEKINLPESPADGAMGKRIIYLGAGDHPYFVPEARGGQTVADAYGIEYERWSAEWNIDIQTQQVDQAINENPDMIIIQATDPNACVPLIRKINQAGIPVMGSGMLLAEEGYKYIITWSGPYDWMQMRKLADKFAEFMNYEGGYCNIRHNPGTSFYESRTFSVITELNEVAPDMELLDMTTTNMEAEATMQIVSDWITRFGDDLKGLICADDNSVFIGVEEALRNAGREDIIVAGAGNSKVGMEAIQNGTAHAITYQSPEIGGAIAVKLAADWFNGLEVGSYYIFPVHIITAEDVEDYMPAEW